MRLLKLLLILFVCAAGPATAGPLEDASAAYAKGDFATALRLMRPFADKGHAGAQYNLGLMYLNGEGVTQNYATALTWFRRAADQGDADAQFNLGTMYRDGLGVPRDYPLAAAWYRKAADRGDAISQSQLGSMYFTGRGVPMDYVQAYMWLTLSLPRFTASQKDYRDRAVGVHKLVAAKMTPAQIAEAQKLAREWKPMLRR